MDEAQRAVIEDCERDAARRVIGEATRRRGRPLGSKDRKPRASPGPRPNAGRPTITANEIAILVNGGIGSPLAEALHANNLNPSQAAGEIVGVLLNAARKGSIPAATWVADRLVPKGRSVAKLFDGAITAGERAERIIQALSVGALDLDEADRATRILSNAAEMALLEELRGKVEGMERAAGVVAGRKALPPPLMAAVVDVTPGRGVSP